MRNPHWTVWAYGILTSIAVITATAVGQHMMLTYGPGATLIVVFAFVWGCLTAIVATKALRIARRREMVAQWKAHLDSFKRFAERSRLIMGSLDDTVVVSVVRSHGGHEVSMHKGANVDCEIVIAALEGMAAKVEHTHQARCVHREDLN